MNPTSFSMRICKNNLATVMSYKIIIKCVSFIIHQTIHITACNMDILWGVSDYVYGLYLQFVLSPDPTPKRGKGLIHIERFLGLADVAFLNSVAPIRFTPCGLHVTIMWHRPIDIANYCCMWELLMHCHAKTMRCHDDHMTYCILCTPKNARCVPDPFLPLGVGSGDETNLQFVILSVYRICYSYLITASLLQTVHNFLIVGRVHLYIVNVSSYICMSACN